MKLHSTLLFIGSSRAAGKLEKRFQTIIYFLTTEVKCMASDAPDAPIQMTATVTNSEVEYDLTTDNDWSCRESTNKEEAICTRTWTADQFDSEGETTFEDDTLILKKTITENCQRKTVDGITLCLEKGHNLEFNAATFSKLQPSTILSTFRAMIQVFQGKVSGNSTTD